MIKRFMRNYSLSTMASRLFSQKMIQKSHRYHNGSRYDKLMRHSSYKDRIKRDESSKRHKSDANYRYTNSRHDAAEKNYKSRTKDLKYYRNDEKYLEDREKFVDRRRRPTSLTEEIKFMMQYEDHHIMFSKGTTVVEWCPKYVKPDLKGHVRGGRDLLHHFCRNCRRLCLHLLGRPGSPKRHCLECSGRWKMEYIPAWYYHNGCKYCSKK